MNPSCLLKIIFDDTGNHLSLCSCINFSNLLSFRFVAPEPKQLMEMRSSLSAESRHGVVNQFILYTLTVAVAKTEKRMILMSMIILLVSQMLIDLIYLPVVDSPRLSHSSCP